jgi:hypothetical protein
MAIEVGQDLLDAIDALKDERDTLRRDGSAVAVLPIKVSAAWASLARRGRPRNPRVPLTVCTSWKMVLSMAALFGSCSKRTSSTSRRSRFSAVSVRKSPKSSSIATPGAGLRDDPRR